MIKRAADELLIDIKKSYMIGDKITDIQMAKEAGMKGILVLTGYGKKDYDIIKKTGLRRLLILPETYMMLLSGF